MREISRSKVAALWVCFLYLGAVAIYQAAQAVTAFFQVWQSKDEAVPRSVVVSGLHALLLGLGVVALGLVTLWIMSGAKQKRIEIEPLAEIPAPAPSIETEEKK